MTLFGTPAILEIIFRFCTFERYSAPQNKRDLDEDISIEKKLRDELRNNQASEQTLQQFMEGMNLSRNKGYSTNNPPEIPMILKRDGDKSYNRSERAPNSIINKAQLLNFDLLQKIACPFFKCKDPDACDFQHEPDDFCFDVKCWLDLRGKQGAEQNVFDRMMKFVKRRR